MVFYVGDSLSGRALAYHERGPWFDSWTGQMSPARPWLLESCGSDSQETTCNKYVAVGKDYLYPVQSQGPHGSLPCAVTGAPWKLALYSH